MRPLTVGEVEKVPTTPVDAPRSHEMARTWKRTPGRSGALRGAKRDPARHVPAVHRGGPLTDPWRCPYCGETFAVPSLTDDHVKREHPEESK